MATPFAALAYRRIGQAPWFDEVYPALLTAADVPWQGAYLLMLGDMWTLAPWRLLSDQPAPIIALRAVQWLAMTLALVVVTMALKSTRARVVAALTFSAYLPAFYFATEARIFGTVTLGAALLTASVLRRHIGLALAGGIIAVGSSFYGWFWCAAAAWVWQGKDLGHPRTWVRPFVLLLPAAMLGLWFSHRVNHIVSTDLVGKLIPYLEGSGYTATAWPVFLAWLAGPGLAWVALPVGVAWMWLWLRLRHSPVVLLGAAVLGLHVVALLGSGYPPHIWHFTPFAVIFAVVAAHAPHSHWQDHAALATVLAGLLGSASHTYPAWIAADTRPIMSIDTHTWRRAMATAGPEDIAVVPNAAAFLFPLATEFAAVPPQRVLLLPTAVSAPPELLPALQSSLRPDQRFMKAADAISDPTHYTWWILTTTWQQLLHSNPCTTHDNPCVEHALNTPTLLKPLPIAGATSQNLRGAWLYRMHGSAADMAAAFAATRDSLFFLVPPL